MAFMIRGDRYRWPRNIVHHDISPDILRNNRRRMIVDTAITRWNSLSSIKFIERTEDERDYVVFRMGPQRCNSPVGRQGGRQYISCALRENNISDAENVATVLHEMGHAVGLFHEHQRPDRSSFVMVDETAEEAEPQNYRIEDGVIWTSYDCASIMHYKRQPGRIINTGCPSDMGTRLCLSSSDITALNWWLELDNNPGYNVSILASDSLLFLLHSTGTIFRYTDVPFRWDILGSHPDTVAIAVSRVGVCRLSRTGVIARYTGNPDNWEEIDANPVNVSIVADRDELYLLHNTGTVFRYTGVPFRWDILGSHPDTVAIAASNRRLYRRCRTGVIARYTGNPDNWEEIDANPVNVSIVADRDELYLLHNTGTVFRYTGVPFRWDILGSHPDTVAIAASGGLLYRCHRDRSIWMYRGSSLEWRQLPRIGHTAPIRQVEAGNFIVYQLLNDGRILAFIIL
ncbi:M12 family metallopeptidase [Fischerella sp. PCC 9605]|uniref:M12 family metallopeptidase n=1 Tax=Fischerella sp. PCC 9605 TaxID=1173024 RepID=UPI00047B9096